MTQRRATPASPPMVWLAVFASLASSGLAACGSRGPLDITIVEGDGADASLDATPPEDAAALHDAAPEAGPVDAGRDASLLTCGACLAQQCGQTILKCLQAPTCRTTLQCAAQKCFATGNTSPTCLLQCSADPAGLLPLVSIVTCITGRCGSDCTSVIGGILGGGGFGGGGGGGSDGG